MTTSPVANANPAALAAPDASTRWTYVGLLPDLGLVQRDLHLGLVAISLATAGIYLTQWPATLRYALVVVLSGAGGVLPASIFALSFLCIGAIRFA